MAQWKCDRCNGTGYANAARDSGMEDAPLMLRPIGVYRCSTCDGRGVLGFSDEVLTAMMGAAERLAKRRMRICKQAPRCPKCRTEQVQIINCKPLATWKCRHCKHTWRHEPLVSNAE